MAATATKIRDVGEAIASGAMPGSFSADRTVFTFPRLEYEGARGARHFWTIRVRLLRGDAPVPIEAAMLAQPPRAPTLGLRAEITVEAQQEDGKVRPAAPTYVASGKNLGRRNATNAVTQALREALGLYNKQKRRADAAQGPSRPPAPGAGRAEAKGPLPPAEAKGLRPPAGLQPPAGPPPLPEAPHERPLPMLASEPGKTSKAVLTPADFKAGITVQRKLDGVRQVVYMRRRPGSAPELVRYSRSGVAWSGQPVLAAELAEFLAAPPAPAGVPAAAYAGAEPYLDGEMFVRGRSLPWITGQARSTKEAGPPLEFHVFDVFFPAAIARGHNMPSRDRQAYLAALFAGPTPPHVRRVEGRPAASQAELDTLVRAFLAEGYEGAIVRKDGAGYEYSPGNHRSASLLKVKPTFDSEFKVVGFTQGTRGKDVGAVLWVCEVAKPRDPRDREFTVTPKNMTYDERKKLFRCLSAPVPGPGGATVTRFERDLKGKPLTVQYQEISAKTGKPLRAKALAFRTYEAGPDSDPVRALFAECLGR